MLRRVPTWPALLAIAGCAAGAGSPVEKPLSFVEVKFAQTVRQQFDFSCGAATVATMLTYYWGRETSEIEVMTVLRSRYPSEDWKKLQDQGFSFDDLIWTVNKFGFEGQGAELPAEELGKLEGPVIVHLNKGKFEHFSVVRAAKAGNVFLSDPVTGAVTMSLEEFSRQYTGKALAIWKRGAPLPKMAILARPYPPIDPSAVVGGAINFRQPVPPPIIGR